MKPGQGRWISSCTEHTHKPHLEYCRDGLVVLNPGSLSYPRQEGRKPSYMLMELDHQGEAHFTICYLEDEDRNQELEQMGYLGISVFEEI